MKRERVATGTVFPEPSLQHTRRIMGEVEMRRGVATILSGVSMLVLAQSAQAQAVSASEPVAQAQETGAEAASEADAQDIVITGSRIVRDGFESPNPVTVLGAESLAATNPQGVADALRQLPQLQG